MKKYWKMRLALLGLLFILFCLTGCEGDHATYTREEVQEYVSQQTPLTEFTVSEESTEENGESYWIVTETGGIGLQFHVVDDISQGLFSSSHFLRDDYDAAAVEYWISEYSDFQRLHPIYSQTETEEITDQDSICPAFSNTEELYVALVGSYADRGELTSLEDEADGFCRFLQNTGYQAGCTFVFQMDFEFRNVVPDLVQTEGDYVGYDITEVTDAVRAEAEECCIMQAVDYRMENWNLRYKMPQPSRQSPYATAMQRGMSMNIIRIWPAGVMHPQSVSGRSM